MIFQLRMAWRSLQRTRALTIVMIVALSLGIGTWYAQTRIFDYLDALLPAAPDDLYQVALAEAPTRQGDALSLVPTILLTQRDADRIVADKTTITFGARGLVDGHPVRIRYSTRDFFTMFEIPLAAGRPWAIDGEVVIDERFARRVFGTVAVVGRQVSVDGKDARIVGVVAARHHDRYHLYERFVRMPEAIYAPYRADAEPDFEYRVAGREPAFAQAWVQLADRTTFSGAGTLRPAAEWRKVYQSAGTINLWPLLAAMCVVTSVVNLVRMLTAKFADRRHDLGLLRAFGAHRRAVVAQLLLEAILIGTIAGVCGIVIGVAMMPLAASTIDAMPGSPTTLSLGAVLVTLAASIGAALVAAIYPAWSLSRGTPAAQIAQRGR